DPSCVASRAELPRTMGHKEGYKTVNEIARACGELKIKALTLYTFSTENWTRPKEETEVIMQLIEMAARAELPTLMENNVRLRVSGQISGLPESLQEALKADIEATKNNTGLILNLAINYGGRQEILSAVKEACRLVRDGKITPEDITEDYFSSLLYTAGLPDPDLLIRTANELRVSNYLLWQIAYAEIWVTPTLWPDFRRQHLIQAIADYQKRIRKFGGVV
ncbi:MAG: polyprenyl diphosphate synthase, partial [Armatimonadota bacterium]|nr:polyprenyl diphosphate synthase [Armatimonadota bacterium]